MKTLPRVAASIYDVTLPVSGKKIKIRPFMAQEEKILLMAMEGADELEIGNAIKQIISNCIMTKDIEVSELPNLDVEKIFIELRRRSVSETIDIVFDLRELFECGKNECPETKKVNIKLDSIEVKNLSKEKKIIMLTDSIGVTLKYPTLNTSAVTPNISKTEALYEIIAGVIDDVFDGDDVSNSSEFEKPVLLDWISNSFQHKQLEEIIEFISNQPYFYKEFEIQCPKCGMTKQHEAKGLIDFFI